MKRLNFMIYIANEQYDHKREKSIILCIINIIITNLEEEIVTFMILTSNNYIHLDGL